MKIDFREAQVESLLKYLNQIKEIKSGTEEIQIEELINTIMFGNEYWTDVASSLDEN